MLKLAAEGNTNPQIADKLGVTLKTVKTHVELILTRLNAANRSNAVAIGIMYGYIQPEV